MRNVFAWSVSVCTLCAALAQAQTPRADAAPHDRPSLSADDKQAVNKLPPRMRLRSFREVPVVHYRPPEPPIRYLAAEDGASKHAVPTPDHRRLSRAFLDAAPPHNRAFLAPLKGEKVNVLPESARAHHLTASSASRHYRPKAPAVERRYIAPQPKHR